MPRLRLNVLRLARSAGAVLALLWLTSLGAQELKEGALARLQKERSLISKVETIQNDRGPFSTAAIRPLLDLGLHYIEEDRCPPAIAALTQALRINRAAEGLFNPMQIELLEPLMECYLALDLQEDFAREQNYVLLLSDINYGKDEPTVLPMLTHAARWYEQAGRYLSARKLYSRCVEIARKAGGANDLRMVEPLRGIARAYRLEYVHGLHAADEEEGYASHLRSTAQLEGPNVRLDRTGEESLRHAVSILRQYGEAERAQLIETLVDLGDWYKMADMRRDAVRAYQDALTAANAADDTEMTLFSRPEPILYRSNAGIALRRPPPDREGYKQYWVDFDYTVTREGEVRDVKVVDSNAPRYLQGRMADSLARTRYRPRFEAGEPVDTFHLKRRQKMWVEKTKFSPWSLFQGTEK